MLNIKATFNKTSINNVSTKDSSTKEVKLPPPISIQALPSRSSPDYNLAQANFLQKIANSSSCPSRSIHELSLSNQPPISVPMSKRKSLQVEHDKSSLDTNCRYVLAIGSKVKTGHEFTLDATILGVMLDSEGTAYKLVWWDDNQRNVEWVYEHEIKPVSPDSKSQIGFTT